MSEMFSYLGVPFTFFGIAAILAMSLQLVLGGAGLLSLGHAAFFAIGGYGAGAFSVFAAPWLGMDSAVSVFFASAGFGCLLAAFAGFLVGLPCLRLSGDYLAVASLGFGEIVATLLKNSEALGGTRGFKDIPRLIPGPWAVWVAVLLTALFLSRLYRTHVGVALMATRDDEIAARSLGISPRRAKLLAFVIGSALAGLAGVLYAFSLQFISPDEAGFTRSVEIVLAVVIGGMYSLWGSFLGAFLMVALPEVLRFAPPFMAENRMLFFSFIVVLLMIFRPAGLMQFFTVRKGRAAHA